MSFLFRKDERKTAPSWRLEKDGSFSLFRDEKDERPITYDEWQDNSYTDDDLKLFKDD